MGASARQAQSDSLLRDDSLCTYLGLMSTGLSNTKSYPQSESSHLKENRFTNREIGCNTEWRTANKIKIKPLYKQYKGALTLPKFTEVID